MNIQVVFNEEHPNRIQIERTCRNMNTVQKYFFFTIMMEKGNELDGSECSPNEFIRMHSEQGQYKIYITDRRFEDNWFSHEGRTCSIITTNDWENLYSPPSIDVYIMYQCAQSALGFVVDLNEDTVMNFVHFKPEGCMFDLCPNKTEIKLGMVAGTICPRCRATLRTYGTPELAIAETERLLSYVRSQAIGKPIVIDNKAFIVMRFSENDENDHAYRYGIKAAFHQLNIAEERADSTIESGPILDKIRRNIEICRFIVVKVDVKNLNVFFELGLSMGLEKDVLLISEEGLVVDLPTDLKNWECLTYPKGNYEVLRDKIINYYKQHYHL